MRLTDRLLRVTVVAQVLAMVAATAIAAPDFVDKLNRPLTCPPDSWCLDFRGADFALLVVFFTPPAVVLAGAAWQLGRRPRLAIAMVLVVDLALVGVAMYVALENGVRPGADPDAPPFPWPLVQGALVLLPAFASLAIALVRLMRPGARANLSIRITRGALVAQVLAMVFCVALTTPHLSDRFSSSDPAAEGAAFLAWTLFLMPAAITQSLAAWQISTMERSWRWGLVAGAADVYLLAFVIFTTFRLGGPPGAQLDQLPAIFVAAQFVFVVIPAGVTLLLVTTHMILRSAVLPSAAQR